MDASDEIRRSVNARFRRRALFMMHLVLALVFLILSLLVPDHNPITLSQMPYTSAGLDTLYTITVILLISLIVHMLYRAWWYNREHAYQRELDRRYPYRNKRHTDPDTMQEIAYLRRQVERLQVQVNNLQTEVYGVTGDDGELRLDESLFYEDELHPAKRKREY